MNDDVQSVLAAFPADCQPGTITALGGSGGFSGARLWRILAARGELVLRRWPAESGTPEHVAFVHAVARFAAEHGFAKLPVPIAARDGGTAVATCGHLWELAPWMRGEADFHRAPTPARLAAAMHALAEFHLAVASFPLESPSHGPSPGLVRRRERLAQVLAGDIDVVAAAVSRASPSPITAIAREWLDCFRPAAAMVAPLLDDAARCDVPIQPCLRDVWHDHVLFEGDEVSAIIDLGGMRPECVAADLARLLGSLVGDDAERYQAGIAAYETVRPLSDNERSLIAAFDRSTVLLSGIEWFRWLYALGRTFDDHAAIAARLAAGLSRLRNLLAGRSPVQPSLGAVQRIDA